MKKIWFSLTVLIYGFLALGWEINLAAMDKQEDQVGKKKYVREKKRMTDDEQILEAKDADELATFLQTSQTTSHYQALRTLVSTTAGNSLEQKINYLIDFFDREDPEIRFYDRDFIWQIIYNYGPFQTADLPRWVEWFIKHSWRSGGGVIVIDDDNDGTSAIDLAIYHNSAGSVEKLLPYQQPSRKAIDFGKQNKFSEVMKVLEGDTNSYSSSSSLKTASTSSAATGTIPQLQEQKATFYNMLRSKGSVTVLMSALGLYAGYRWIMGVRRHGQQNNVLINNTGSDIFVSEEGYKSVKISKNEVFILQKGTLTVKISSDQNMSQTLTINLAGYKFPGKDYHINITISKSWFSWWTRKPFMYSVSWVRKKSK